VALTGDGRQVWVLEDGGSADKVVARLVGTDGKTQKSFGPATDVVKVDHDGREVAVLYHHVEDKSGAARYSVEVREIEGGKRLAPPTRLSVDARGHSSALDFRLHSFSRGYLSAVGTKGGAFDPVENQRTPDYQASYDMISRRVADTRPITDLMEYRLTMMARSDHPNRNSFVYVADGNTLMRVNEGGRQNIELAESFSHYDARTVESQELADGGLVFAIRIDPVHPEAAAARRAVLPWTDLYHLAPGQTTAERKARFLHKGKRRLLWQATDTMLAILPMHRGFDRGGERLYLYELR
jgi:hypothetical protein